MPEPEPAPAEVPPVSVTAHVQRKGWEKSWARDGAMAGTQGKSRRAEAIQVVLVAKDAPAPVAVHKLRQKFFGTDSLGKRITNSKASNEIREDHIMRFENATPEQTKKHEVAEERVSFESENIVELSNEQLNDLAGGAGGSYSSDDVCPVTGKSHYWYDTCETRPSKFGESNPPDRKMCCKRCGKIVWQRVLMA